MISPSALESTLAATAGSGITTISHLRALLYIYANPGLTATRAARHIGVTSAALTGIMDSFEKLGLIRKAPTTDRRTHALHATNEAEVFIARLTRIESF